MKKKVILSKIFAMKYTIAIEHRDYFRKNHFIEFDELLTPKQLQELREGVEWALTQRLQKARQQRSPSSLFRVGHDLWRDHPSIKKIATSSQLAFIASELVEFKPLRLGYDQFFPGISLKNAHWQEDQPYPQLLRALQSLEEISCIKRILCGLLLCLSPPKEKVSSSPLFSQTSGNGVYFHPSFPIHFDALFHGEGASYLLIVYAHPSALYFFNEKDFHTYSLKNRGYIFGDKLKNKLNPIVT